MTLDAIVTFRWKPAHGYRSTFGPETVNSLFAMLRRHYAETFRAICVTDDPSGIDTSIDVVPLWDDFSRIPSPHGGNNPSCYRRLKAYATEMCQTFGNRFAMMDLDMVATGDLRSVFERPEDFVICEDRGGRNPYNGSMVLMTAGARRQVLDQFDPEKSPYEAMRAGCAGSDQGWVAHVLGPNEAQWTREDGVYSYRNDIEKNGRRLPENARLVSFHGRADPWGDEAQRVDWIRANYPLPARAA